MLSDRERTALQEIQYGLTLEDPELARSFHAIEQPRRGHCFRRWAYTCAITFTALMSGVMLLAALPAGMLLFAAATWGLLAARRADPAAVRRPEAAARISDRPGPGFEATPQARPQGSPRAGSSPTHGNPAPIVVGVDGSAAGEDALAWAAAEAAAVGRPLRIVHADVTPGLLVQAQDAELLVVGTRSRGHLAALFVRSAGIEIAAESPCPVVVVGSPAAHRTGPSAGRVVVGVDDEDRSWPAVEFAFQTAARRGVGLTGIHAWTPPLASFAGCDLAPVLTELHAAEEQRMRLLLAAFATLRRNTPDVDVQVKLVRAHPTHALVSESAGAALIVIGSPKKSLRRGIHPGSTSRAVLQRAECPVAVIGARSQASHS